MRLLLLPLLFLLTAAASPAEFARWKAEAAQVTITRDDWGIAHVKAPTDAGAVFGMIYAQAEDDFPRIEANYLAALGRTAEADGEKAIWQDLRARLYVGEEELRRDYARSPDWLKRLMDSWANGLNFYLATHPQVKPRVLTRFEPWMALSFTEGSIGANIESIDLQGLEKFYSGRSTLAAAEVDPELKGSNGIAIAPRLTSGGKALLLINPHTSFFFRSEQQVTSGEGLNAYGAATWGQFFIYQGFNARAGWMHTTSGIDNVDEFAVEVRQAELGPRYRFGREWRPLQQQKVTIRYKDGSGPLKARSFITYGTHRGPIVRHGDNGRWVAFAMMDSPVEALQQSFLRTKASDLGSFLRVAGLKANSSNNTVFASASGEIAFLMPQFVPVRDDRFDYKGVVDGSDPATDWRGLHSLAELPSTTGPSTGWVQNTNNWPWSAAGPASSDAARFPKYMDLFGENPRGLHAVDLLGNTRGWTLERLQSAAYSRRQPSLERLVPRLVAAWDGLPDGDPRRSRLSGPVAQLRKWDHRWSTDSVANTIANFWMDDLWKNVTAPEWDDGLPVFARLERVPPGRMIADLDNAVARIKRDFGTWRVEWGEVNRFQRISPAIDHPFSDSAPSIPVGFSSGRWGSLASFGASPKAGTKRWYGTGGNSFVAVVEFGPRLRARAVTAGGASGDPASPHFKDQAERYASGALREVYFHPDQLTGHVERVYRPGE